MAVRLVCPDCEASVRVPDGAPTPQVGDLVPAVVVGTEGIDLVAEPQPRVVEARVVEARVVEPEPRVAELRVAGLRVAGLR